MRGPMLLNVHQASQALNISRASLYRVLERGELRSVQIGARRLVPQWALFEYIESLETTRDGHATR
jgi:excisionase family DNA binding protein